MNKRGPVYKPVHERVLARTHIPLNKDECWEWQGPVNNAGFGMIRGDSSLGDPKMVTVHRVIARYECMPIKDREVQHTCLNKICVNPKHLTIGTPKERTNRIIKKHGRQFNKIKNPYKQCEHCGKTSHVIWFSRQHGHCYPGMMNEYYKFLNKKV